ncbi:gonadal protein gdl [Drosophila kikkawai]|uniref:Gonadal protein gdl n=1 Tax=Drosophila kikkawai TaxID=30033 RepID=A0A6P4JI97_DROKI|nr:gonadal protein gdl [Drosophila kikkawai]
MADMAATNEGNSNSSEAAPLELQQPTPEYIQRKIYFLVDHLRKFHAELPENLQTRISYDLLTELANCVLNEGIFVIVKALMELQHETERHLNKMRLQVENEYDIEVAGWKSKIKDPEELQHILGLIKIKHTKKLLETDKKIINILDQKVNDQQSTLQKAGVPGFYVTENPKEIKIQMFLLDFILRLSSLKYEPNK